jgi:hypothetical protein
LYAKFLQLFLQQVVKRFYILPLVLATRYPTLIANHDEQVALVLQGFQALAQARRKYKIIATKNVVVSVIAVDYAIAV